MEPAEVVMEGKNVNSVDIKTADTAPPLPTSSEPIVGVVEEVGIVTMHKQSWGVRSLAVAWFGGLLVSFTIVFDSQTINAYQPYATSSFGAASLLGTIGTVQNVVQAGISNPSSYP